MQIANEEIKLILARYNPFDLSQFAKTAYVLENAEDTITNKEAFTSAMILRFRDNE